MYKISIISLAILFSFQSYSQHTIELFVYSDYKGPTIDFTAEESGKENKFHGFRLLRWRENKSFDGYRDKKYGRPLNLNCVELKKGLNRGDFQRIIDKTGNILYDKRYKDVHFINIVRSEPFTLKYFAQENGPSKGTWTGVIKSRKTSTSKDKDLINCRLLNLNQLNSSVTHFGRLYFKHFNMACDGFHEISINNKYIGKFECKPPSAGNMLVTENNFKAICDEYPLIYGNQILISKQLEYGAYTIKDVFKANNSKIIRTKNYKIKLYEPCQQGYKE